MLDFLDKPLVQFLAFGFLPCVSMFVWYVEAPDSVDKKTKKRRSYYERWKLAPWSLRWYVIAGCASAVVAVISLLELLGLVKIVGS